VTGHFTILTEPVFLVIPFILSPVLGDEVDFRAVVDKLSPL
jgi:hypothetical protein